MKGQLLTKVVSSLGKWAKPAISVMRSNSPAILAGTAIIGAGVIAYTTYKCTPKYKQAVDYEEIKTQAPVPKKTKAKIFVKTMWPMMVALLVTCGAIYGSHKINAKRIATLSAAYSIATQKATEAAEKKAEEFIKDKMGSETAEEYKKEVEAEHKENDKVLNSANVSNDILETGGGEDLFIDYMTGITFKASAAYIERCVDMINEMLETQYDEYVTYQDVLSNIIPDCPQSGFAMSEGYSVAAKDIPLMVKFTGSRRLANGRMATLMKFNHSPASLYEE